MTSTVKESFVVLCVIHRILQGVRFNRMRLVLVIAVFKDVVIEREVGME